MVCMEFRKLLATLISWTGLLVPSWTWRAWSMRLPGSFRAEVNTHQCAECQNFDFSKFAHGREHLMRDRLGTQVVPRCGVYCGSRWGLALLFLTWYVVRACAAGSVWHAFFHRVHRQELASALGSAGAEGGWARYVVRGPPTSWAAA